MLRLIWLATACLGVVIVWIASRPSTPEARVEKSRFEDSVPAAPLAAAGPVPETSKVEPPPAPMIERPKLPAPPPPEAPVAAADNQPIAPELAADLPAVDVAAQLAVRIEEFSQARPVEVRLLLRQIAELSAVPVDLSAVEKDPWKAMLDQEITVSLKDTTVEGILAEVLGQTGLQWQLRQEAITILPLDP
jgi:hypothetical protein